MKISMAMSKINIYDIIVVGILMYGLVLVGSLVGVSIYLWTHGPMFMLESLTYCPCP